MSFAEDLERVFGRGSQVWISGFPRIFNPKTRQQVHFGPLALVIDFSPACGQQSQTSAPLRSESYRACFLKQHLLPEIACNTCMPM